MIVNFSALCIGDVFQLNAKYYEVISTIFVGCCSPQANAKNTENEELIYVGLQTPVDKVSIYKTNPANILYIKKRYVQAFVLEDEELPVFSDSLYVMPTREKAFVAYEETDTWLRYFGLGDMFRKRYYERFNGDWVKHEF